MKENFKIMYIGKVIITLAILGLSWKYPLALFLLLPTWWNINN